MDFLLGLLPNLLKDHPSILAALALIGGLRLIFKPVFALAHAVAEAIPGDKDNKFVDSVEQSKAVKAILFVLDWIASVKVKA